MNTHMYEHPLTAKNLSVLKELNIQIIEPLSQKLACGDIGIGAMAKPPAIVSAIKESLEMRTKKK